MYKSKKLFLFSALIAFIVVILRTWLIINNTSNEGFYIDLNSKLLFCFRFILIVSSLSLFILPFFDKFPEENRSRNKDKLLGISMAIFGGVIMFVGLVDFFTILQLIWSTHIGELFYFITNTPNALMRILLASVSFITGWMVTTLSMKILNDKPIDNNYGVSVMFVIWAVMRSMLFTRINTTIVTIPDNLYTVITIIFSLLFLFGISRILFNVNIKSGYKITLSSGFILIIYGLLTTLPHYIAFPFHKNVFFSISNTSGITNIILSFFAFIFLYIILFSEGEKSQLFNQHK